MHYKKLATAGALLAGFINAATALPALHNGTTSYESVTTNPTTRLGGAESTSSGNVHSTVPAAESTTTAQVGPSPSVSASSNEKPTKHALADAACTYTNINPTDVPTASPYVSARGVNYYPAGSQSGNILAGNAHPGWVFGPAQFPASNSYALAVQQCSAFCDSSAVNGHGQCLSFNVFTVYESDFANCTPTFECRFTSNVYNASDYFTDNGTPSYVWTLKSPVMPTCDVNVDYSPAVWTTAGMDDFLMSYARTQNIYQTSSGFMAKLMNLLNWKDYDCDGPLAADASKCVDSVNTAAQPCANWLNRQADLYFTYMDQIYKTYNTWQAFMGNQGPVVYESFWNKNPPQSSTFNWKSVVETTMNSILGCIPDFGSVIQGIAEIGESIYDAEPTNAPVVGPNQGSTWNIFISVVSQAMSNLATQIVSVGALQGATGTVLEVMQNGAFFLDSADKVEINADAIWANYKPFFMTQAAVAAMRSQGVFLLRAPISGVKASSCTQAVADQMASYIASADTAKTAWCDTDGAHVVIPVNGWNMDVYRVLDSVNQSPLNLTVTQVGTSAIECSSGFGTSNATISPYATRPMTGWNFMTQVPDLTAECVWPLPVCDFDTWNAIAVNQSTNEGHFYYNKADYYPLNFQDNLHDVGEWCSYQFGFQSQMSWCGVYNWCSPPYGCAPQEQCETVKGWTKKIFTVV